MKNKKKILHWKGMLSVSDAQSLKEELSLHLFQGDFALDLSGVEDIDVAVMQVILACFKEAAAKGKQFALTGILSADLKRFLFYCGLIARTDSPDAQIFDEIARRVIPAQTEGQ